MEKPVYVSGYVRNRRPKPTNINWPAIAVMVSAIAILAVIHWQFTLTAFGLGELAYFLRRYHKFLSSPNRLVVNYYGMTATSHLFHNVIEMVKERG